MPKKQYTSTTEEGFYLRIEARLKNAKLVGARELAGLKIKDVVEKIGINYQSYCGYESMRNYPSKETQKKICEFYRGLGIFLLEEDVFPEELKELELKRKYISEKSVEKPKLISLTAIDKKLLPPIQPEAEKKVEQDELYAKLDEFLSELPYRQQQVLKMRFGFGDEKPKTLEEIGGTFGLSGERIRQIETKAMKRLKKYYRHKLEPFLERY